MRSKLDPFKFRTRLLAWYDVHHRALPWRKARSPYQIWISEIMLQQTRVAAVIDRYSTFLKRFPSLRSVAAAREADVQAAWSGLGYYRRARSLREAAQIVVREHGGRLPREVATLKALPGIGEYTAAAIASIAFGKPAAVVDGNVRRVLARLFRASMTASSYQRTAENLLSPVRPGDFNQAMMELGATVCLPVPKCHVCPVHAMCAGKGEKQPTPRRNRTRRVASQLALAERKKSVYLVQRDASSGIMPMMWELPEARMPRGEMVLKLKHSITNTIYSVEVHRVPSPTRSHGRWILRERLREMPLTGLTRKILHRTGIL